MIAVLGGGAFSRAAVNVVAITQWLPVTDEERNLSAPRIDPDAGAEVLFWHVHVMDEFRGEDPETVLFNYLRIKIFNQRGCESQGTQSIEFSGNRVITDVAGRTIKPDGTILELAKSAIFEHDLVKAGGRKLKSISFVMPGVEPGVTLEYRWRERRHNEFADYVRLPFWRDIPVHQIKYFIRPLTTHGSDISMKVASFHVHLPPANRERDGFSSIEIRDVPAYADEPLMPSEWLVRPWALLYYAEDKKISPDKYWTDLGRKVYGDLKPYVKASDAVRQAADEICAGAKDPEEKIARLMQFCRTRIKRLSDQDVTEQERQKAKENHTPADTLKRGIGDGFDVNMLFAAMAAAEGFETRMARLADRSDLPFDRNFPNDYFMRDWDIAVKVAEEWRFYDATALRLPIGMLRWNEEGAQALISDPREPVMVQTPISEPEKSLAARKAAFELSEDGTIEGSVQLAFSGHQAADRRADRAAESAAQREESVREIVRSQFNNAEISEVKVENVEDAEKPLTLSYHVKVPGYAQRTGKRLLVQLAYFEHGLPAKFASSERKYPIMFQYPWSEEDQVTLKVPPGYLVESPTAPESFPIGEVGEYSASISTRDGQLVYHRTLAFGRGGRLAYQLEGYPLLKSTFDTIYAQDQNTLTLRQVGAGK